MKPTTIKGKTEKKEVKLPIAKFRSGAIQLSIWENEQEKDGEKFANYSFNIEKSYKDGEEWKKTHSFHKNDIAKVQALLNKTSEFLLIDEDEDIEST